MSGLALLAHSADMSLGLETAEPLTDGTRLTEAAGAATDLEPTLPSPAQSASISGTQSGPRPVIDGSHFLHKKCEKSLIDHGVKCPARARRHLTWPRT